MKLRFCVFASFLLVLGVAACGGESTPVGEDPSDWATTVATVVDEVVESETPSSTTVAQEQQSAASATTVATTAPPTTTEAPLVEGVEPVGLLSDLFSSDIDRIASAVELTAPGSPARFYAEWQANHNRVWLAAGLSNPPAQATRQGEQIELCLDGPDSCLDYSGFLEVDGLLSNFTVDGTQIDSRLGGGSEAAQQGPLSVRVLGSYRTVSGDALGVHLEISSTQEIELALYDAEYVTADGQQVRQAENYGADSLRADARALVTVFFQNVNPGGQIFIKAFGDDFASTYEVSLSVPALL